MRKIAVLALAALMIPFVGAEFGKEIGNYPVNVDGDVIFPYIPKDIADSHPELVPSLLNPESLLDEAPVNKVNGYTLFPYYPILVAELQRLATEHPEIARLHTIGQSRLGLDLFMLEIADFSNPNGTSLADREVVYLDGGTHSNEYSGVYFVTEWAQFLLDEYKTNETAKWIVENRHTFIVPMVNPDGSNVMGRLNALTVNINRNFPSTWGTVAADTPPLNWGGPYPMSEPETQAVVGLMQEIRPDFVDSIHCCGNLWLHPYGAEQLGHAPDFEMFSNMCRTIFPDLTVNVSRIQCGETWSTIYPASGTTLDEGYGLVGAASWSYEMSGRGAVAPWGQPIIDADVRIQESESWRGVMHGFLNVEKYGAHPSIEAAMIGEKGNLQFVLRNDGYGPMVNATIKVGKEFQSIPTLAPGQAVMLGDLGIVTAGQIPVEIHYPKRIHPQSNVGDLRFNFDVVSSDGALKVMVPESVAGPTMGDLLPESAGFLNPTQADIQTQAVQTQDAPGFMPILSLIALLAIAIRSRK